MSTVEQYMRSAVEQHRAGNVEEAARLYGKVLAREPRHADALNLLGVALLHRGDAVAAVARLREAAAARPDDPRIHYNLALALRASGDLDGASTAFERTLALQPAHPDAHTGLGILRLAAGDPEGARQKFERALLLNPNQPQALTNLAAALGALGRETESLDAFQRAAEMAPDLLEAQQNLRTAATRALGADGAVARLRRVAARHPHLAPPRIALAQALRAGGDLDVAIAEALRAVAVEPRHMPARLEAASFLLDANRPAEALVHAKVVIDADPRHGTAWMLTGIALRRLHFVADAARCFAEAAARLPRPVGAWRALGQTRLELGDHEGARQALARAVELAPDDPETSAALADLDEHTGALEEARARLAPLIERHPNLPEVARLGAVLAADDAEAARAAERLTGALGALPPLDPRRAGLELTLARTLDRLGRADEAFAAAERGNALAVDRFDAAEHEGLVERIIEAFPERHGPVRGVDDDRPVFVIGLPRSGTSLVEQMLATHPDVCGAGERSTIPEQALRMGQEAGVGAEYPEAVALLAAGDLERRARAWLDPLVSVAGEARRITDKMPLNFLHVGYITRLFPNARFVHVVRDARDTGLSLFFEDFVGLYPYAHRLEDIAAYIRAYRRIMAHWEAIGVPMHTVTYEALVADPEGEGRRLLAHLDLPWDPAVLGFHRNPRVVLSASYQQVRLPLYSSSVGRWRAYAGHLGPLLDLEVTG